MRCRYFFAADEAIAARRDDQLAFLGFVDSALRFFFSVFGLAMGLLSEEVVVIRQGKNKADPVEITVNCLDKVGLGCDLSRIVFEFGLCVVRADVSTDCKWCLVIFWVVPDARSSRPTDWVMLKNRLVESCPPSSLMFYYVLNPEPEPKPKQLYVLQIGSVDRTGLLNDVSEALWELELTIHKVKVWTMPDDNCMDLFYITDNRELLHTEKRKEATCNYLKKMLGETSTYCELRLSSPEFGGLECTTTSLSPSVAENMFSHCLSELETDLKNGVGYERKNCVSVSLDNSLSPAHTLLQIKCKSHKGLLYDVMRTLKDYNIQGSYVRLSTNAKGICEMDLFVLQADGKKILDCDKQNAFCSRLEMEISNPVRVMVTNRGPDTELLVATPIELSGRGRPRVLYDVTLALKILDICIFTADIGRNIIGGCQWEVYRFLLNDRHDLALENSHMRKQVVENVRKMLVG